MNKKMVINNTKNLFNEKVKAVIITYDCKDKEFRISPVISDVGYNFFKSYINPTLVYDQVEWLCKSLLNIEEKLEQMLIIDKKHKESNKKKEKARKIEERTYYKDLDREDAIGQKKKKTKKNPKEVRK